MVIELLLQRTNVTPSSDAFGGDPQGGRISGADSLPLARNG